VPDDAYDGLVVAPAPAVVRPPCAQLGKHAALPREGSQQECAHAKSGGHWLLLVHGVTFAQNENA